MNAKLNALWRGAFLLTLALTACQTSQPAAPSQPTLHEVMGTVAIQPYGGMEFHPARDGSTLAEGGTMQTGATSRARLDLPNGAVIRLAPLSTVELTAGESFARLTLSGGQIFILGDAAPNLNVETPSGVASARGSFMMVAVDSATRDVLVACLEGPCEASNPAGKVQFTAGQKSLLLKRDPSTGGYPAPGVQPMEQAEYQAWLEEVPEAQALARHGLASLPEAPAATSTPTQPPGSAPSSPPPTPTTEAAVAAGGLGPCISLVSPAEGEVVDHNNPVTFEWTSRVQASRYVLELSYPDGSVVVFETAELQVTRYFDGLRETIRFSWKVSATDANGSPMCSSPSGTFTKPAPQPTKAKEVIPPVAPGPVPNP